MPPSKLSSRLLLLHPPPRPKQKETTHSARTAFSEDLYFPRRKREDYGVEKIIKIKPARVLVASFKQISPPLQPLHFWFLFCRVIISFKHTEV